MHTIQGSIVLILLLSSLFLQPILAENNEISFHYNIENNYTMKMTHSIIIHNPYEEIDFQTIHHYKANLHTHTTESDGSSDPEIVINLYHGMGSYDILAITDHNKNTWPWTDWINETPLESSESAEYYPGLNMLAISGNEMSRGHHRGSLLNDFNYGGFFYRFAFHYIQKNQGLSIFYHPGRYSHSAEWYNTYFNDYNDCIVGIEVYNQGDRYQNDRVLWDEINKNRSPDDLKWGFSNDDMHRISNHAFRNYQHFLMNDLSEEEFKQTMIQGTFYFSYEPDGSNSSSTSYGVAMTPKIQDITINDYVISIQGINTTSIEWYNDDSELILVHTSLDVSEIESNFVRAVLINEYGRTYTQPFGLEKTQKI